MNAKKVGFIGLDFETADRITVQNLEQYRKLLKKELKAFKKGSYLHPEDAANNIKMVKALDLVIKQFKAVSVEQCIQELKNV
jgi:hypothetical protein